ncbi:hypothetical protein RRG08_057996 [Elysia crispata]|uniref:Uncharacterized protein n=1 Tax=Elysia crispata TaxID=231223 RepID=A0AAE1DY87_9GAST|nr:hypothetical protein RRG08_057996 [Elysia crispata]
MFSLLDQGGSDLSNLSLVSVSHSGERLGIQYVEITMSGPVARAKALKTSVRLALAPAGIVSGEGKTSQWHQRASSVVREKPVKPLSSLCQSRVLSHGVESPAPTSIFPMLITCVITWGGVSSSNLYLPYANHVCYHMGWRLERFPISSL